MTSHDWLQKAVGLHQAGDWVAAESIYRKILADHPDQPDACHLLGVLIGQHGDRAGGIALIRRAIASRGNEASFHNNLGNLLREVGDRSAAVAAFDRAIELQPDYFEAHNNLGNALLDLGQTASAVSAYETAVRLKTYDSKLRTNLGIALLADRKIDASLACHKTAVEQSPLQASAWTAFGAALLQSARASAALVAFERAAALEPNVADHHVHMAAALRDMGELDRAADACAAALRCDSQSSAAHNTLANVLADQGDFERSLEHSRRAIELRPGFAEAYMNLGVGLVERGEFPAALRAFEKAIELDPQLAEAHRNYGVALLTLGQFEHGFAEYQWRWKSPWFRSHACNVEPPDVPRWSGESIAGKTILLQAEQGLGDTIQFARFIPQVVARGANVIVQCPSSLVSLIQSIPGIDRAVTSCKLLPARSFAVHCPLMSLPLVLQKNSEPISANVPYLACDSRTRSAWQTRCAPHANRPKIGLAWAGNPKLQTDARRSIAFKLLLPLLEACPAAAWFSLQLGMASAQRSEKIIDFTEHLSDFSDTAGLIEQLDLVIAVDTAVAHLAGALGKATWVLIPRISDWRWQLDRTDSPWYPAMRLFRQTTDWPTTIAEMASNLSVTDLRA